MVASRPLTLDASAPQWAIRLVNDLEKAYVKATPSAPQLLAAFVSSNLPDASAYVGCIISVSDMSCVAISDGTAWKRADGSAL